MGGGARGSVVEEVGVVESVGGDGAAGVLDEVFEEPININGGDNVGEVSVTGTHNVEVPSVEVPNVSVGADSVVAVNITSEAKLEGPGDGNLTEGVGEVAGNVSAMEMV